MSEIPMKFLKNWREANVCAEPRALEQLDATVAQCIADAVEAGISADDLARAAGGSLKEYLRAAIIDTSAPRRQRRIPSVLRDRTAHPLPLRTLDAMSARGPSRRILCWNLMSAFGVLQTLYEASTKQIDSE